MNPTLISRACRITAVALAVASRAAPARAQSDGVLLCDGSGTAVSKPVGEQQWSIQYDPRLNAVNGTVFNPSDSSIQFVSCFRTEATPSLFTFDCASPAADDPEVWETFAEGVSLAPDFFRLPSFYIVPDLTSLFGSHLRIATDARADGAASLFFDWQADDALDGDVLRGTNVATGNPFVIQATYSSDRLGSGPANYFATEFADDRCENYLFNVQLLPTPEGAETSDGLITGTGFTTGRDEEGLCLTPGEVPEEDTWGGAGVVGAIRTTFRFSVIPPRTVEIAP